MREPKKWSMKKVLEESEEMPEPIRVMPRGDGFGIKEKKKSARMKKPKGALVSGIRG